VLRDFLTRVRAAQLTLHPSKCFIGFPTLTFLGHEVGEFGIAPNSQTVEKILNAARPQNKKELRSFLALVGYYHKFIPIFAAIAVALTDLTRKGTPNILVWEHPQERAFQALKGFVASRPILRLPNFDAKFLLQTDSSSRGIGAALLQEFDGVKHPIGFASRKLLPRECNYSTVERECLAIVWAVQKFSMYLYGRKFILETDHQSLQYLNKARLQNSRLMRWAMALQPFSFAVHVIKGSANVCADYLSRA